MSCTLMFIAQRKSDCVLIKHVGQWIYATCYGPNTSGIRNECKLEWCMLRCITASQTRLVAQDAFQVQGQHPSQWVREHRKSRGRKIHVTEQIILIFVIIRKLPNIFNKLTLPYRHKRSMPTVFPSSKNLIIPRITLNEKFL